MKKDLSWIKQLSEKPSKYALSGLTVFDGERSYFNHHIIINHGKILRLSKSVPKSYVTISCPGLIACPGFIDAQVNGACGYDFYENPSLSELKKISHFLSSKGTTSFLPTLLTSSKDTLKKFTTVVQTALVENVPGVIGAHFEGPGLNPEKKGIHSIKHIRTLESTDLRIINQMDGVKLITLASEVVSEKIISQLVRSDKTVVSLGHSMATFEQAKKAFSLGASGITHLFNACPPLLSREPGLVGAALDAEQVYVCLIADGIHVHPSLLSLVFKAKSKDKIILVSDCMPPLGSRLTNFFLQGKQIFVKGRMLVDEAGTLAGANLTLLDIVVYLTQELQFSPDDVLRSVTANVADFLKIENERGRIASGMCADLLFLTDRMDLSGVIQSGELIHKK